MDQNDIEAITNFPTLDKLQSIILDFDGSSSNDITPAKMPNLVFLDWKKDSGADADFFVPFFQLQQLDVVYLEDNALRTIPDFYNVSSTSMGVFLTTDSCAKDLSIRFPNSKLPFRLTLNSRTDTIYAIKFLGGINNYTN